MGLLSDLLEQVASSEPSEVLIATERPLTLVHAEGTESIDGLVTDHDVYEALSELLGPEQQAELAVGRRVELDLTAGDERWRVVAETGTDTISIRAQPAIDRDGLDADEVVVIFPTDAWATADVREDVADFELEVDIEVEEIDDAATRRHATLPLRRAGRRPPPIRRGPRSGRNARTADPRRDARELAASLVPGSLCFLHWGQGLGATIARALHQSVLMVDESASEESVRDDLWALEEGAVVVIAVEDPSPWLPWILRRVEEGMRVVLETRATTHEGARRILLGVDASPRAEAWLGAVRMTSAALRDGRWSVVA
ncbi:MAG: hypothetical protein R3A79_08625 [Nannocystaceae bacterium]